MSTSATIVPQAATVDETVDGTGGKDNPGDRLGGGSSSGHGVAMRPEYVPYLADFTAEAWLGFLREEEVYRARGGESCHELKQLILEEPFELIDLVLGGVAKLNSIELREKINAYFAPPDRRGMLAEFEKLAMPRQSGEQAEIVNTTRVHKYLGGWQRTLKLCPAGGDNRPKEKLLVKTFIRGLQPRLLQLRVDAEYVESIKEALAVTLEEVQRIYRAQVLLGWDSAAKSRPAGPH